MVQSAANSQSTHEKLLDIASGEARQEPPNRHVLVYSTVSLKGDQLELLLSRCFEQENQGMSIGIGWPSEDLLVYLSSPQGAGHHTCRTVKHAVPWGSAGTDVGPGLQRDGVISWSVKAAEIARCWPPPGEPSPGVLVDAAAMDGLVALLFRKLEPIPDIAGGGGSVVLLSPQLQLLATLPLDMPPASIDLSTDYGVMTTTSQGVDTGILAVGFLDGGVEVSSLSRGA